MKIIATAHYESRFSKRGLKGNYKKVAQLAYEQGRVRVNDTWIMAVKWFENTNYGAPFGEKIIWFGGYQFRTTYNKWTREIIIKTVVRQFSDE